MHYNFISFQESGHYIRWTWMCLVLDNFDSILTRALRTIWLRGQQYMAETAIDPPIHRK